MSVFFIQVRLEYLVKSTGKRRRAVKANKNYELLHLHC